MNNIETQIIQLIKEMKLSKSDNLNMDSCLKADVGLDSLSFTELLIEIEDRFEIEIDLDDPNLPSIRTLGDFRDAILALK
jgi:acyl carrier protein